jgi:hypothetical protein
MPRLFVTPTEDTRPAEILDGRPEVGPGIFSAYESESPVFAEMASENMVVMMN